MKKSTAKSMEKGKAKCTEERRVKFIEKSTAKPIRLPGIINFICILKKS